MHTLKVSIKKTNKVVKDITTNNQVYYGKDSSSALNIKIGNGQDALME